MIRKVVAGAALAASLGVAGLLGSATAFADVSTNGTVSDEHGYGIATTSPTSTATTTASGISAPR